MYAEPKFTFEVAGERTVFSEGKTKKEKLRSLSDLSAQSRGLGKISAALEAQVTLWVDLSGIPQNHRPRSLRVRTWLEAGSASVMDPRYQFGLPGRKPEPHRNDSAYDSIIVQLNEKKSHFRVPLKISALVSGSGAQGGSYGSAKPTLTYGTVICAASILVSNIPAGSLTESAALNGKLTSLDPSTGRVRVAKPSMSAAALSNPMTSESDYKKASKAELQTRLINEVVTLPPRILVGDAPKDGVSAHYDPKSLERLAAAFWGADWNRGQKTPRLRMRNVWAESWGYPVARLSHAVPWTKERVKVEVKFSVPGYKRLEAMPPAEGLPPMLVQSEEELKRFPAGGVGFSVGGESSRLKTAQVFAVRMMLHSSGTLESLSADGKVTRSQPIKWRSDRFSGSANKPQVGIIKLAGGYSSGPFLMEELLY